MLLLALSVCSKLYFPPEFAILTLAWGCGVAGVGQRRRRQGRGRGSLPSVMLRLPRLAGNGSTDVGNLHACFFWSSGNRL